MMAAEGARSGTYGGRTGDTKKKTTTTSPTTPPPGWTPGLPPAWQPTTPAPTYVPGVPAGLLPPTITTTPVPTGGGGGMPSGGGGTTFAPAGSGWFGGGGGAAPTTPSSGYGGTSFGMVSPAAAAPPEPQWAQNFQQQALGLLSSILGMVPPTMGPAFPAAQYGIQQAGRALGGQPMAPYVPPGVPGMVTPPSDYTMGVPPAWQSTGPGVPRPTTPATPTTAPYLPMVMRGPGFETTAPTLRETYASAGAPTAPALGIATPAATPVPAPGGGGYGGGGGGGYYGTTPTTTTAEGLPVVYSTWFESIFGPVATYYTPERGGVGQAYKDYQSLMYLWQSLTGSLPTIEQLNGMLTIIKQRLGVLGRAPTFDDVLDYVRFLASPKGNPPTISYLNVGEV